MRRNADIRLEKSFNSQKKSGQTQLHLIRFFAVMGDEGIEPPTTWV